jgi:hypothetical protein
MERAQKPYPHQINENAGDEADLIEITRAKPQTFSNIQNDGK